MPVEMCNCYTTSTTTTTNLYVWEAWLSNSTASTTGNIWYSWNNTATGFSTSYQVAPPAPRERSAAEVEAAAERTRQRQRDQQRRQDVTDQAAARATDLLRSILTPAQWADWEANRSFLLDVNEHQYRIERGTAGNVIRVDGEGDIESLCAHPPLSERADDGERWPVPTEDVIVAQVLALRSDEDEFRRIANISPRRRVALAA